VVVKHKAAGLGAKVGTTKAHRKVGYAVGAVGVGGVTLQVAVVYQ